MHRNFLVFICALTMGLSCAKTPEAPKTPSLENQATAKQVVPIASKNRRVILPPSKIVLGDKNAPISLVVFVNYFCANCARADRLIKELFNDPELKSQINLSYRQLPTTFASFKAAKVVLAASLQGDDKFWSMSQKLFSVDGKIDEKNYLTWAREINLDEKRFARDMLEQETKISEMIKFDRNIVAFIKRHGAQSGIFVDGFLFREDLNLPNLKKFIKTVIAAKKRKSESNIADASVSTALPTS